jgi:hypothetical protein
MAVMAGPLEPSARQRIERVAIAFYYRRGRKLIVRPGYTERLRAIGCNMHLFKIKDQ